MQRLIFILVLMSSLCPPWIRAQTMTSTEALQAVAAIHGMTGPFAVAGFRMGERSLKEFHLSRGSVALDVTHKTPYRVQWSCIADGVQAATGASLGKLNLRLVEATPAEVQTIIADRDNGKQLVFRLKKSFSEKFLDLSEDNLSAAGAQAEQLSDDEIFTVEVKRSNSASNHEY
jgi:formylmethanofuran dehydrogenase subunit E